MCARAARRQRPHISTVAVPVAAAAAACFARALALVLVQAYQRRSGIWDGDCVVDSLGDAPPQISVAGHFDQGELRADLGQLEGAPHLDPYDIWAFRKGVVRARHGRVEVRALVQLLPQRSEDQLTVVEGVGHWHWSPRDGAVVASAFSEFYNISPVVLVLEVVTHHVRDNLRGL